MNKDTVSIIASAVAVIFSLGAVLYYAVSIEKDVENLFEEVQRIETQVSENGGKINPIESNLQRIDTDIKHYGKSIENIDSKVTEIQKQIAVQARIMSDQLAKLNDSLGKLEKTSN